MSTQRPPHIYSNGMTADQCKQAAEDICVGLRGVLDDGKSISWSELLEKVEDDEFKYKLVLRYLRRDGYNIGDYRRPRITR